MDNFFQNFLISALLGGLIGFEREYRDKSAGFRTMILICTGSTLFMRMSLEVAELNRLADPGRIASYVVGGIGFLGAGVIVKDHGKISGLTTASCIWFVAAIGIACGGGYLEEAVVAAITVLIVLWILPHVENLIGKFNEWRTYKIELGKDIDRQLVYELAKEHGISIVSYNLKRHGGNMHISIRTRATLRRQNNFAHHLLKSPQVNSIEY
jgi:putative Mg2+ transporter-C (MgtC) family protein